MFLTGTSAVQPDLHISAGSLLLCLLSGSLTSKDCLDRRGARATGCFRNTRRQVWERSSHVPQGGQRLELDPCEGLHGKSWRFIVELNNNFEIVGMIIILFFLWPSWKSGHDLVA